jgi:CRISPR associated protein Cas1
VEWEFRLHTSGDYLGSSVARGPEGIDDCAERDGSVLATTGRTRSVDAKLRRAQALAFESGSALKISRELIDRKLAGQAQVARDSLVDSDAATKILECRSSIAEADKLDMSRLIEARAAQVYWSAWKNVSVGFPRQDLARVPNHWRTFSSRASPLTGSPRLAANPANAMLNYLYAILEAEARLAAASTAMKNARRPSARNAAPNNREWIQKKSSAKTDHIRPANNQMINMNQPLTLVVIAAYIRRSSSLGHFQP